MIEALQQATGTQSNVDAILLAIEATLPLESLFSDVAEAPKAIRQQDIDADELQQLLASFVEAMVPGKDTLPVAVAESILATPVFSTQPSARAILAGLRRIEG
ncbi:hypothetical protein VDR21_21345 [Xanthomonas campestris pv. campestris]|nr:hypothetical protein [Xanthomonas campestris pv. campestris]MEB1865932.1 hypothetical protein [Xanthomonas campestris pv. campestris]